MDHNQQGGPRRGHFHRGRRGADRRAHERRQTPPEQPAPRGGDQVDVEQIMREIRARIAQRHGIELSSQQVQELAARRLEAILDPRNVKPALLEQLRKSAGAPSADAMSTPEPEPSYTFEESTLFESHRWVLRFIRALLKPVLKLFFNPNPLITALNIQSKLNTAAAAREQERDRRQAEWNALHYELLQRMVTETARISIELQNLSLRIESLSAKVDFNERRVRGIEGLQAQGARQMPRPSDVQAPAPAVVAAGAGSAITPAAESPGTSAAGAPTQGDGQRRRRRRRRGRRGGGASTDETGGTAAASLAATDDLSTSENGLTDDGADDDVVEEFEPETDGIGASAQADQAAEAAVDVSVPAAVQTEEPTPASAVETPPAAAPAEPPAVTSADAPDGIVRNDG